MKNVLILLAVVVALGISSISFAAAKAAAKGKIKSIDGTKVTITDKKGTDSVIDTDASTKVKVDGADATFADLKVGMTVTSVTPDTGTATEIDATTKAAKKPKKPATSEPAAAN